MVAVTLPAHAELDAPMSAVTIIHTKDFMLFSIRKCHHGSADSEQYVTALKQCAYRAIVTDSSRRNWAGLFQEIGSAKVAVRPVRSMAKQLVDCTSISRVNASALWADSPLTNSDSLPNRAHSANKVQQTLQTRLDLHPLANPSL